jgi:hypothetical protein
MAGVPLPEMTPWKRRSLTIPPDSRRAWIELAIWELWMGVLVCAVLGFGALLIATAPDRIVTASDLSGCYGPPPVALPCERIVYRGGALYAAFSALCGSVLILVAGWFLWELWSSVEPKPIADDFLRLLHDSFGRDWRNPFTWPWARVLWAYGFASVGAGLALAAGLLVWAAASPDPGRTPAARIDTSQSFSLGSGGR